MDEHVRQFLRKVILDIGAALEIREEALGLLTGEFLMMVNERPIARAMARSIAGLPYIDSIKRLRNDTPGLSPKEAKDTVGALEAAGLYARPAA